MRHHRIVEAVWRREGAVAPFRFGEWFRDRDGLLDALEPRREALAAALELVAGAGEHAVRIVGPAGATEAGPTGAGPGGGPGRAYLEAAARRRHAEEGREERGRELAARLGQRVEGLVRDERVHPLQAGGLVSVAHLVEREMEARYGAAVEGFAAEHPELRVVRGGPWPPYSFMP